MVIKLNEETLRVMYQRITETRPHQQALANDLEQLMNAIRQVLERLEEFCCDNGDDEVLSTDPNRTAFRSLHHLDPGGGGGYSLIWGI